MISMIYGRHKRNTTLLLWKRFMLNVEGKHTWLVCNLANIYYFQVIRKG